MQEMVDWLSIILDASQRIRRAILPLFSCRETETKLGVGAGGDEIEEIDVAAENALVHTLLDYNVSCTLISEESGTKRLGSNPSLYFVTVDPLDGTTNALRGIPFMATSIAVSRKPNIQHVETALVADLYHDITYTAQKNEGAHRNKRNISPSTVHELEKAVIGLDFNTYKKAELANMLEHILKTARHLRHFGANALELCYVADGTTDAFIDLRGKLRVTDIAAAYLILQESGGTITSPKGEKLTTPLDPREHVSFIAAGNMRLHETIMKSLKCQK